MYLVVKKLADYTINSLYIFRDPKTRKTFNILGDFPELLPSMTVDLDFEVTPKGNILKSVNVYRTDRNIKMLEKHKINPETYFHKLSLHNETGISFKDLKYVDDPYVYSHDISGLEGFAKSDKIAKALGYDMMNPKRLNAIKDKLLEIFRGRRQEKYSLEEYMNVYRKIESAGSFELMDNDAVLESTKSFIYTDDLYLADTELFNARRYLDEKMKKYRNEWHNLLSKKEIMTYLDNNTLLQDEQRKAVEKLADTRPTIIRGGAGTGKTTTVKGIIELYSNHFNPEKICLLAPTGKASRRLAEATGMPATTIHNRLRKTPDDDFVYYGEDRKLPFTLFIVDEASMIDTLLMECLLKAIPEQAKLYLIGDCNQLYPVGCGEPFHEMIKNKECEIVTLKRNFRQDANSGISENAYGILKGELIREYDDFSIMHIDKEDILKYASEDEQNITPYNSINAAINKNIIAKHTGSDIPVFYEGEKVIAIKNTSEYFNGDIGIIEQVNVGNIVIKFPENVVTVHREDYNLIMPAYSLTVHKCQGSEYDTVNIFLPEEKNRFITRRLVYTAITRARKKVNLYLYSAA